jgi:recombination protein RecA
MARDATAAGRVRDVVRQAVEKAVGDDVFDLTVEPTGYVSTGLPTVDYAIGRPGIPLGRLTVIRGEPATGKSSLLHAAIAAVQRVGGVAALLETEDALDFTRMRALGVDVDDLVLLHPRCVEQALDAIGALIDTIRSAAVGVPVLIGWDSVAATPTRAELTAEAGAPTMGLHARLLSQALRKYTPRIAREQVALVIVNQTRHRMVSLPYADPTTMIAHLPLSFHATLIFDVRRVGVLRGGRGGGPPTGIEMEVRVAKNKLAPPLRTASVQLDFTRGFDIPRAWLDLALAVGVVERRGSWYRPTDGGPPFQERAWATDVLPRLRDAIAARAFSDTDLGPSALADASGDDADDAVNDVGGDDEADGGVDGGGGVYEPSVAAR